MTQPASQAHDDQLLGGLRHLLPRLSRAHLCLVLGWTEKQLAAIQEGSAPEVPPDVRDTLQFDGDVALLLGRIRHHLQQLPVSQLLLLHHWVQRELSGSESGE